MRQRKLRAISLVSGGLDSYLSSKLAILAGLDVELLHIRFPISPIPKAVTELAKALDRPLKIVTLGEDYLRILHNPRYGYGRAINPCIDCKIYFLKIAKEYSYTILADLIVTGDVIGQRPKSQRDINTLLLIEERAGLKGKVLRPLSAKLLPPTLYEQLGLIPREIFLAIHGRSRRKQLALINAFRFNSYSSPAGGCIFTEKEFAKRFLCLKTVKGKTLNWSEIYLLRLGRFIIPPTETNNVLIIPRNMKENRLLNLIAEKLSWGWLIQVKLKTGKRGGSPTDNTPSYLSTLMMKLSAPTRQDENTVKLLLRRYWGKYLQEREPQLNYIRLPKSIETDTAEGYESSVSK